MFFVISGYVIAGSMARSRCVSLSAFILEFYQKRIKRLVPALLLFAITTSLAIVLLDDFPRRSLLTGAASFFGLSNITLAFHSVDYFAEGSNLNAFLHTWSLGAEEQFYLFFPFLFWILYLRRIAKTSNLFFVGVVFALSATSLAAFVTFYSSHQSIVYFLMPTRFWELGLGVIFYLASAKPSWLNGRLLEIPPSLPLGVVVAIFFSPTDFAIANTIIVAVSTSVLISCLRETTLTYSFLCSRPLVFFGLISYSLYLWHWSVLVITRLTFGVTFEVIPILFATMIGLASASYFFVEKPLRYRNWAASKRLEVGVGIACSVFGVCFVLTLNGFQSTINLANIMGYDISHIQRTWWADRTSGEYLETCHAQHAFSEDLLDMCIPKTEESPRVFLIGDSHARNYLKTIQTAFDDRDVSYLTMGHDCAYIPEHLSEKVKNVRCVDYVRQVTNQILEVASFEDIVVIGQRLYERPERWGPEYFEFLTEQADLFIAKGARVILLDATYPPAQDPRFCVDLPWRPERDGCSISKSEVLMAFSQFDEMAMQLAEERDRLFYVALRTELCVSDVCGQRTRDGIPVWHDRGHITDAAAAELSAPLLFHLSNSGFFK